MAAGDPVVESGSVSGGGTTTVSVPSGETWVLSAYAVNRQKMTVRLTDGSNSNNAVVGSEYSGGPAGHSQRLVVSPNLEPEIENGECSSREWALSGREI